MILMGPSEAMLHRMGRYADRRAKETGREYMATVLLDPENERPPVLWLMPGREMHGSGGEMVEFT